MKNKFKLHLIFWLVFFFYITYAEYSYLSMFFQDHVKNMTSIKTLFYAFVTNFILSFVTIPCFYALLAIIDTKKISLDKKYFLLFITITFFVIIFRLLMNDVIHGMIYPIQEKYETFSLFGIFNSLMNLGFSSSLALCMEKMRQQILLQQELNDIKSTQLSNEIKFLKSQINPHFLFNTLNNIYGLSLKKADETPEIILKLSKIMRYNIYDSAQEFVSITKEIENIEDFIEIHKIRYKNIEVSFTHSIDDYYQKISPLLLLQFVENAFKHGASESVNKCYISIKLTLINHQLVFEVENSKEKSQNIDSTKIGLINIQKQLEILYVNNHSLQINDTKDIFNIMLKLDLK